MSHWYFRRAGYLETDGLRSDDPITGADVQRIWTLRAM